MLQSVLGAAPGSFLVVTVVLTGFAAFMTGQALANTWRPFWQVVVYCLLLAAAARFLLYGLFEGQLWSISGYLVGAALLVLIGTTAFHLTRARRMVSQYPWLYCRAGPFGWRDVQSDPPAIRRDAA